MRQTTLLRNLIMTMMMMATAPSWGQDAAGSDALLNGYVQQMIDASLPASEQPAAATRSALDHLTGNDARLYNLLLSKLRDIAAGRQLTAQIDIAPDDICGEKCVWTAADLGVASLVDQGYITEEATNAAWAKLAFDINAVMWALTADLPYDLYWYDKTKGMRYTTAMLNCDYETLYMTGSYTFFFYVSKDYSVNDEAGTFDMKPGIVASVDDAIANAAAIVEANKDKPLLEKLQAYREAICQRVSYNFEAAGAGSFAYGNPWQLVWVFDDDATTNVVCEGYAKAFKYLCDLSELGPSAECLIVSGSLVKDTGSESHMWNVMKMDDGRSYHVDVTNCDEGMSGYPDKLFLAYGPTGTYSYFTFKEVGTTYNYKDETKTLFTEEELTISATAYDPATGINLTPTLSKGEGAWFGLDGHRLDGQPTRKGIYIRNGKKVIIK